MASVGIVPFQKHILTQNSIIHLSIATFGATGGYWPNNNTECLASRRSLNNTGFPRCHSAAAVARSFLFNIWQRRIHKTLQLLSSFGFLLNCHSPSSSSPHRSRRVLFSVGSIKMKCTICSDRTELWLYKTHQGIKRGEISNAGEQIEFCL